jgi:hypothetical protein
MAVPDVLRDGEADAGNRGLDREHVVVTGRFPGAPVIPGGRLFAQPIQPVEQYGLLADIQSFVDVGYQQWRVSEQSCCGPTVLSVDDGVSR